MRARRPAPPDETLLPDRHKAAEVAYWERYVEQGWTRGIQQADQTFTVQLNRLVRDLIGMALYCELLAKGMVTPPRLTERQRGITTDRKVMRVNDRLLTIAEDTHFQTKNQRWKPYPTRPYPPPKHAPTVHFHILASTPPPAATPPPVLASPWEGQAGWQR